MTEELDKLEAALTFRSAHQERAKDSVKKAAALGGNPIMHDIIIYEAACAHLASQRAMAGDTGAALKAVECFYEERLPYWSADAVMSAYGKTIRAALRQSSKPPLVIGDDGRSGGSGSGWIKSVNVPVEVVEKMAVALEKYMEHPLHLTHSVGLYEEYKAGEEALALAAPYVKGGGSDA